VTTTFQVGGALGLAIVTTLSITRATDALAHGVPQQHALTDGFQRGILVAALFAVANLLVTLMTPQIQPTSEQLAEATAAA
jgi:hypothetical protein